MFRRFTPRVVGGANDMVQRRVLGNWQRGSITLQPAQWNCRVAVSPHLDGPGDVQLLDRLRFRSHVNRHHIHRHHINQGDFVGESKYDRAIGESIIISDLLKGPVDVYLQRLGGVRSSRQGGKGGKKDRGPVGPR